MEMMVVLLIVAIIAAASAPMVTKKLSRSAGTNDSPWVFTGLNNNIAYNMNGGDASAIIGNTTYVRGANGPQFPRLVLASGNDAQRPALVFADANGNYSGQINMNAATGVVTMNNAPVGQESVAMGLGQTLGENVSRTAAFGHGVTTLGSCPIAIGYQASATNNNAIAIGAPTARRDIQNVRAQGRESIAIGTSVTAEGDNSIVIGSPQLGNIFGINTQDRAEAVGANSIAIGTSADATRDNAIAIGNDTGASAIGATSVGAGASASNEGATALGRAGNASGLQSIAIGGSQTADTRAEGNNSIAIGSEAHTSNVHTVAIGSVAESSGQNAISIGGYANASNVNTIALGIETEASHENSVAIGAKAKTTKNNEIVLGTKEDTVYIPGNLVVGRRVLLNRETASFHTTINPWGHNGNWFVEDNGHSDCMLKANRGTNEQAEHHALYVHYSDRRLKNVGEKYTAGLSELKKLDFFHYTFKDDKEKTPHVGVMAQDLQKVFPDAVTKGEDGYLRIRLEDMFYAVINAVKELDNKIAEIVQNITDINSTIEKQNKTIEEQQKTIDELVKRIEKLEKQK